MELDDATWNELAAFFARRFPQAADRRRLAEAAGVIDPGGADAPAAWAALLKAAAGSRRLGRVVDAALVDFPNDKNLAEMRDLVLRGGPPKRQGGLVVALVGGGLILLTAWVLASSGRKPDDTPRGAVSLLGGEPTAGAAVATAAGPTAPPPLVPLPATVSMPEAATGTAGVSGAAVAGAVPVPPVEAAKPVEATAVVETKPLVETKPVETKPVETKPVEAKPVEAKPVEAKPVAVAKPVETKPVAVAKPVEAKPVAVAKPVEAKPVEAKPADPAVATTPARPIPSACRAAEGTLVGYWYAGKESPGPQGSWITLKGGANVRLDYPHAENGWAKSGKVVCTLPPGAHQRLSRAPVRVDPGNWWVPLMGGDVGE